jgi:hypothetical protein
MADIVEVRERVPYIKLGRGWKRYFAFMKKTNLITKGDD